jgi:hypothetical protein
LSANAYASMTRPNALGAGKNGKAVARAEGDQTLSQTALKALDIKSHS